MLEKKLNTLRRETRNQPNSNRYGESYYEFDISDEHSIFVDYHKQRQPQGSNPSF
jgi:hypothetical protein